MKYPIIDKLEKLKIDGCYPFHMPGHKRKKLDIFRADLFSYDITEITGFDDLHHPEGMIRDTMDFMKEIYGTKESYLLVNSSTAGILAAISAVCNSKDTILISRNCHKSVYHAIQLLNLNPIYIYPKIEHEICKPVNKEKIEEILDKHVEIKAVVIVSPTYEGNVSDIKSISRILHKKGVPLIVDEAHGAHFCFHEKFPQSAVEQGADIVIQSLHKTLPSLTQTGLLHYNSQIIEKEKVEEYLSIYQSSSPSYILMASIDYCVRMCRERKDLFQKYVDSLQDLRRELKNLKYLSLMNSDDIGKIVISTENTNITGEELFEGMRDKYHIELEMAETSYVIAMTSICDDSEDLQRLRDALFEIDQTLEHVMKNEKRCWSFQNKIQMTPNQARRKEKKQVDYRKTEGKIGASFVYLYPPGIPIIVPGEEITKEAILKIDEYRSVGMNVIGLKDQKIYIVNERK
ncbi:MAG: aminotransferase class I/II-fold pyridoxal phosphate-dependent enzyme [Anaerostipes sp.]|nr:aminotransferase class I/II-fold pyridoxal phosphate-dependent enzyme [Anaerostipes sp.]